MKRIALVLVMVFAMGMAMGQHVVNGVYQGSPTSFMYLTPQTGSTSTSWNNSWVKPSYGDDYNDYTHHQGVSTSSYPSHRFVLRQNDAQGLPNDPCFRNCTGQDYVRPRMAEAWNSDEFSGTFEDTVIQLGVPGKSSQNPSGIYCQQMLYSFVPDTNNPVLLLNFAFVTEDARHNYQNNPGVEFAILDHNTGNLLNIGYYDAAHQFPHSRFWFRTPSSNGTPDPENTPVAIPTTSCPVPTTCPCQSTSTPVFVYPYTIVAFNLSAQAYNRQAVDFRIRVRACDYTYHWAYCYYTAKMIPAKLQVKYCGGDTLHMHMPWGFNDASYQWWNGTDSNHVSPIFPEDQSESYVFPNSTTCNPLLKANPNKPYYRCEVVSYSGVPFTYEATVNFYDLKPSFTLEPKALTDGRNCDLGIVLHNTSQIGVITPDGNGGVDTTWQDLVMNPEQCTWNFGDGTPEVHGFQPEHIYAQPGTYTVSLYIEDYERVCKSATIDTTITFLPKYTEKQYAEDQATTCEGKLPYYYKPELFGYDNVQTKWDINAVGERHVNYTYALPQYEIRAWNGCDSIVKVQFDVLTPAVTIQEAGTDFCDSAQTLLEAQVSNVRENAVHFEWSYLDSIMSVSNTMLAVSDGIYSVSIVDTTTGCEASTTYKIEPCVPNVFLPNCITPTRSVNEGPAQNDYLYLDQFVQRFISEVKFMVYARNGEQVYSYEGKKNVAGQFEPQPPFADLPAEMNGRLVLWDGMVKGRIVDGTYTYVLWIVSGGQQYLYKGKLIVM